MSATPADDTTDRQRAQPVERYAQLILDDERYIIYDREQHTAWMQSSVAVSLEDYR